MPIDAECTTPETPKAGRSWFGSPEDVHAYYRKIEASPLYAEFYRPDADDIRRRRIEHSRKRRVRKPSLRSVLAMSKRAGVEVAGYTIAADGTITITPGKPIVAHAEDAPAVAVEANDWTVL